MLEYNCENIDINVNIDTNINIKTNIYIYIYIYKEIVKRKTKSLSFLNE